MHSWYVFEELNCVATYKNDFVYTLHTKMAFHYAYNIRCMQLHF